MSSARHDAATATVELTQLFDIYAGRCDGARPPDCPGADRMQPRVSAAELVRCRGRCRPRGRATGGGPSGDALWALVAERVVLIAVWYSRAVSGSVPQIRLLLVEDVAQVAQYIRNLLNAQDQVKLLDVADRWPARRSTRSASSAPTCS